MTIVLPRRTSDKTNRLVVELENGGDWSDSKSRRSARESGKSDSIDAFSVAGAALREGLATLPGAHLDGRALDIRLLSDHRDDLVNARTEDQQRLRWHLHDLWPEFEIPSGALRAERSPTRR